MKHVQGDIFSLPFSNDEFDRIHLERFFQVFPQAASDQIFAQLDRVLKHNGRIIMVDMDIATVSVDFSDNEFERKVINHFALKMRPNAFAGRQFADILKKNHYRDVSIELMHHRLGSLTQTYFLNWIISGALAAKIITQTEADKWNEELRQRVEDGNLLAYITNVLVSGSKS